jgi:predicted small lipoprotein YifL
MRTLTLPALGAAAAVAVAVAGCGQKGPLVKPTRSPTTPVVIHAPAPADTTPTPPDADPPKR